MRLEYGLVENALDSLRESMAYYTEGDETHNVNQYKFWTSSAFSRRQILYGSSFIESPFHRQRAAYWGLGSPCKCRFDIKRRCLRFSCVARKA